MMTESHDTDANLQLAALEEEKQQVGLAEVPTVEENLNNPTEETAEETTPESEVVITYEPKKSKEEVIARLKELSRDAKSAEKQELDMLKQNFYKLHKAEQEAARKAFIEAGGAEEAFVPQPDSLEDEYKATMADIKQKRSAMFARQEREKEDNLLKKQEIINQLKEMVESPDNANKSYSDFKRLQQQWNEIKSVPAGKVNELWKSYQHYVEKFYDLLKLNSEFREYDFKKNLEIKTHLCEAAEKLAEEPDVISAFHQLQKLHQEFRDTGPVAKDLRESIWTRFKTASALVNRRHQAHFEQLRESEQHNLDQKTVICEIVEATEYDQLKTFIDWENKTKEIIALQAKWKTIGFAPQKMNVKIFERFRSACDDFFKRKGEFYKSIKESFAANLEKKKSLCEQAEALKESTDWKAAADRLAKLQKDWKEIGPAPKKYSDAVWKRFISACDYFFEQKSKATNSQRSVEHENLARKNEITRRLNGIDLENVTDDTAAQVRLLVKEWNSIGHVPFKEKDKVYKEFHAITDKLFDRLNLTAAQKRISHSKSGLKEAAGKEGSTLYREREKLARSYETMKNEIQTYENNIGFLNTTSKKGSSLIDEMNRKVEKLKVELEQILERINALNDSLNEEK